MEDEVLDCVLRQNGVVHRIAQPPFLILFQWNVPLMLWLAKGIDGKELDRHISTLQPRTQLPVGLSLPNVPSLVIFNSREARH